MLAIGRALMARPRLLMLDEPSLGLAPLIVAEVFRLIESLKAQGATILLVEQNARKALAVADTAYVLEGGRITRSGPAAALRDDPAHRGGVPRPPHLIPCTPRCGPDLRRGPQSSGKDRRTASAMAAISSSGIVGTLSRSISPSRCSSDSHDAKGRFCPRSISQIVGPRAPDQRSIGQPMRGGRRRERARASLELARLGHSDP